MADEPVVKVSGSAEWLTRERVVDIQRKRIITAMVQVACERGVSNVTVAHVVERCGVSRRTFYEIFDDRDDCFLAAFDDAVDQLAKRVVPAYESTRGRWRDRVRAALVELLAFCEREPKLARVALLESLTGGGAALERRAEIHAALVAAVDEGSAEAGGGAKLNSLTAEGVVGGVLAVLTARLSEPQELASPSGRRAAQPILALTGSLMSMIVLPYLGSAAAKREIARPVPTPAAGEHAHQNGGINLHDLGMRLTYRTLRVLMAVREHPDGSNRLVGETAGISDQGQISKLLGRLKRLGLVSNTGAEAGKGMPNAWSLTERGRQITDSVRAHGGEESR